MIITTFVFAIQDGISLYLAGRYNTVTIVTIRYWFFAVFVILLLKKPWKGSNNSISSRHLLLQIIRGLLLVLEVCVMVYAFTKLGLVQSHAIFIIYPLLIAFLAGPLLKETVTLSRWIAIVMGFCGVFIILQPEVLVFNLLYLVPFCSALMFAIYAILTRYVTANDSSEVSFFWTGIIGAIAITFWGPFFWDPPVGGDWLWMGALCLSGAFGHYLLIKTLETAEASAIQPFSYFQLVFASIFGVIIFNEAITIKVFVGTSIIILAGLITFYVEKNVQHQD